MKKRYVLLSLAVVTLVITLGFSDAGSEDQSLACLACSGDGRIVEKAQGEAFIVEMTFKNTGENDGTWSVNIAFECESWSWSGTSQNLTLKPCSKKALTWNGDVPEDAPMDSVARLIVYYDGSYETLDRWIHVINSAELTITSNTVK